MRSEAEVLESINSLRSQLGMQPQSEPVAPTAESAQDVQARIDALNKKLATTPMSRREFLEKRIADDQMSFGQTAYQFGVGMGEGFSMLFNQGKDAVKEFYQGEIAHQLVRDCENYGGYLTLDDLKNYQVIERKPLIVDYKQNTFLTNSPPSSGGILIAFALELLANVDFTNIKFGSAKHLQILKEVMQLTNIARKDRYNTNIYQEDVEKSFLSSEHINIYTQQLNKWGSTTHISVIDAEGNAASTTTSHGEGCGYVIPGTGIMMNNMLGEEDLNPHGFHQWQENVRISSMMAPTIVLKDNQPEIF